MRSIVMAFVLLPWVVVSATAEPVDQNQAAAPPAGEQAAETVETDATASGTAPAEVAAPAAADIGEAGMDNVEQVGFSRGSVTRSVFTTGIEEREPIDDVKNTDVSTDSIYYFTELRDMSGQTATHRWEHNGEIMAEVDFDVKGPRWRVWSSKSFVPGWTGDWKVSVINGAGEVISEDTLTLSSVPADAGMMAEPATEPAAEPAMPSNTAEEATGQ